MLRSSKTTTDANRSMLKKQRVERLAFLFVVFLPIMLAGCYGMKSVRLLDVPYLFKANQLERGIETKLIVINDELHIYSRIRHPDLANRTDWSAKFFVHYENGTMDTLVREQLALEDLCIIPLRMEQSGKIEIRVYSEDGVLETLRSWCYFESYQGSRMKYAAQLASDWGVRGQSNSTGIPAKAGGNSFSFTEKDLLWYPFSSESGKLTWVHNGETTNPTACSFRQTEDDFPPPPFSNRVKKQAQWQDLDDCAAFNEEGSYRYIFEIDSLATTFFLRRSSNDFPSVRSPAELAKPLRYISTINEYEELMNSADLKQGIDDYWLKRCGSYERARKVIKQFYGRVERSNLQFSDDREGWCTDRGMIYIVFGTPNRVMRHKGVEKWLYLNSSQAGDLSFTFEEKGGRWEMNRADQYRKPWNENVYLWRNGILNSVSD